MAISPLDRRADPLTGEEAALVAEIRHRVRPLRGPDDLDPLMERIGDARYVLLGEASHGTADYYNWRAQITRRLIEEKGFSFLAVEGDWPDCERINRYVRGYADSGASGKDVLHAFARWPTWMWANSEILTLVEWLRERNDGLPNAARAGFYGLDVYSLWESLEAVVGYLQKTDPSAVEDAKRSLACFEPFGEDAQEYAWHTAMAPNSCEEEVVALLKNLRTRLPEYPSDGPEAKFNAEQNALVARNAERYYRAMIRSDAGSWNVRDTHMADTLERLMRYHGPDAKAIVWEHNTHVGDARATDMARAGMVNVGQIVREAHAARDVVLVGFGSYAGNVIAGDSWGAPMRRMDVPPAQEGSWEALLHAACPENGLLLTDDLADVSGSGQRRGHRAIGVVYNPARERGNYVPSRLPARYDAFLFLDQTQALHPLHMPKVDTREPETYPSAV